MSEIKYSLNAGKTLSISDSDANRLISAGDGLACLLYIYILKEGGETDEKKAALALKKTPEEILRALSVLTKIGLISKTSPAPETTAAPEIKERPDELPQYTAEDIKRELSNGEEFSAIVSEVQSVLGRYLSSNELIKLFGIYDYLGLPAEVIVLLVSHCQTQQEKRYGKGSRLTLRAVEREAYLWERRGIVTLELAEDYIRKADDINKKGEPIRRIIGLLSRPLTATEKKYVDAWAQMDFPIETIELAYDKTVVSTGKMSWGYMHKILTSWQEKGIKSPEEAKNESRSTASSKKRDKKPAEADASQPSGTTDDELERMRRLIDYMNSH